MKFEEFSALHYAALARDEIRHNVILSILKRRKNDPDLQARTWHLGVPGACAVQQNGYGIVLGAVDREQARALALEVVGDSIPSVLGPDDTAKWFVEASADVGESFPDLMAQTIHVIDHLPRHLSCEGVSRLASSADAERVLEWMKAFVDEAVPHDQPPTLEDVRQRIDKQRVYFWCVDDKPVAMSCVGRQLEAGIAIAPVYTPPAFRRRGYAGAATAAIVAEVLRRGQRFACLYTDDSNAAAVALLCEHWLSAPTANRTCTASNRYIAAISLPLASPPFSQGSGAS